MCLFPGMVLFVKRMGECLVFITILFVTQSAIAVAGAMNDPIGFAKVSHSKFIKSFFLFWFYLFLSYVQLIGLKWKLVLFVCRYLTAT